jgi:branched-chain amino acid transport system permease protein
MRRSRTGRVLIASRDNPRAAQAYGVGLVRAKLAAFAMSGFLAAVAGALFSYQQGAVDTGRLPGHQQPGGLRHGRGRRTVPADGAVLGAIYLVGLERVPGLRDVELVSC